MQKYLEQLINDGVSEGRANDLATAVEALHKAICKLDLRNLRIFMTHGYAGNLKRYAELENLRDVVTEIWDNKIERALRLTDVSGEIDVREKTDRLHDELQDFVELGLPGAALCDAALCKYRKLLETSLVVDPSNLPTKPTLEHYVTHNENWDISRHEDDGGVTYFLHGTTELDTGELMELCSFDNFVSISVFAPDKDLCIRASK